MSTTCDQCITCDADDCDAVAYCLATPGAGPCEHARALCENHWLDGECDGCTADLERQITADTIRDALQAAFDNTAARDNRDNTDPDPWNPHNWHSFRHADHYGPGYHQAHKDKP
jgi:hypothetical protein